jgi:DNA-binding beta-propeller fold protein YncE
MRLGRIAIAFWTLALGIQGFAAPIQQSETLSVGPVPTTLAVDAASGKVIIGNAGAGRGQPGSVAILERSGKLTTVATTSGPLDVTVSATRRKAIATLGWEGLAALVDLDTLATTSLAVGKGPLKSLIDDRAGVAYVIGVDRQMDMSTGWPQATSTTYVSVIDLATRAVQTYSSIGFAPEDAALSPDGKRLYIAGAHYLRTGEAKPGFVQAFDVASRTFAGAPLMLGREAKRVLVSPRGDKVYVGGHRDFSRPDLPADDMRRSSIRGAVFVLDAATLAVQRTVDLPDTRNLDLFGPMLSPQAQVDPATGFVHVLERVNAWLAAVDPVNGKLLGVTDFETFPTAFAINAQAGTMVVSLPYFGQAAILSRGGARLDTVPVGRAPAANTPMGSYAVAVDGASGDTYLTNGHDQSISVLRRNGEAAALVNLTDVWFDAADPGWGVFIDHQGIVMFAALFIHDAAGDPTWLTMSSGVRQADGSFSGVLYRTRGPATQAVGDITPVGIMRITPDTGGSAKLLYVIDGQSRTRVVERFVFDGAARQCAWGVGLAKSAAGSSNFTSLWSDPREQGWGIAVSHQGSTAFGVLFDYDAQNRPTWSLMSNGRQQANGRFTGELYRARRGKIAAVGSLTLDFASADAGGVAYRIEGVDYRAPIARQAMTPLMSRCAQ